MIDRRTLIAGFTSLPAAALAVPAAADARPSPDAPLIAHAARVVAIAWREREALERLRDREALYRELCPPKPLIPESTMEEVYSAATLMAMSQVIKPSSQHEASELQGRSHRLRSYEDGCAELFERLRLRAAVLLAERWNARLVEEARQLTFMPPSTPMGLAAKARAWLTMKRLASPDQSFEWAVDLAEMTIRESLTIGAVS